VRQLAALCIKVFSRLGESVLLRPVRVRAREDVRHDQQRYSGFLQQLGKVNLYDFNALIPGSPRFDVPTGNEHCFG
jgi:hypothetical protein